MLHADAHFLSLLFLFLANLFSFLLRPLSPAMMASSKTSFRFFWVREELSM